MAGKGDSQINNHFEKEDQSVGGINNKVYLAYCNAVGKILFAIILLSVVLMKG